MHLRDAIYQGGGLLADAALDSAQLFRAQPDGSLKILNVNLAAALDADPLENVLVQPRDRIIVHRSLYRVDPPSVYIRGRSGQSGPLSPRREYASRGFAAARRAARNAAPTSPMAT